MPMLRFSIGTWVMSSPFIRTVPELGSMKPVIVRSVVVFPQPEGPRNVKNSPSLTWTLMSWRASNSPNLTKMLLSLIKIIASLVTYYTYYIETPYTKSGSHKTAWGKNIINATTRITAM